MLSPSQVERLAENLAELCLNPVTHFSVVAAIAHAEAPVGHRRRRTGLGLRMWGTGGQA